MFITAEIVGGLGNQMFMIAHAVAQGLKNNTPVMFDVNHWLTASTGEQHVHYNYKIFNKITKVNFLPETNNITEAHHNDPKLNFNLDKPIKFFGYYQSINNFLGFDKEIQELFSPDIEDINKLTSLYPQITEEKVISIHVRRGDYCRLPHILPIIDKSYYIDVMEQNNDYDYLFIFTDDKNWVVNNLSFKNSIIVENLINYEALWLMSLCKINIIANSTFSWWAGFLNKNKNKKIFVPSIWFGPSGPFPYYNIYPADWIKVNVINKNNILYTK